VFREYVVRISVGTSRLEQVARTRCISCFHHSNVTVCSSSRTDEIEGSAYPWLLRQLVRAALSYCCQYGRFGMTGGPTASIIKARKENPHNPTGHINPRSLSDLTLCYLCVRSEWQDLSVRREVYRIMLLGVIERFVKNVFTRRTELRQPYVSDSSGRVVWDIRSSEMCIHTLACAKDAISIGLKDWTYVLF
jgi:hypothetical protein